MQAIDNIKNKLKRLFSITKTPSNHVPYKVFQVDDEIFFQYYNTSENLYYELKSKDGFDFTFSKKFQYFNNLQFKNAVRLKDKLSKSETVYYGDRKIQMAKIDKNGHLEIFDNPVIEEAKPVELSNIFERKDGRLIFYFSKEIYEGKTHYEAYIALLSRGFESEVLWKLEEPIWRQQEVWNGKEVVPLGSVLINERIYSYWFVDNSLLYVISHSGFLYDPLNIKNLKMQKHELNPIISPNKNNHWESFNTLNPAVFEADNKVHILYRAQGYDYISTVGYAWSHDGVNVEYKHPVPIYAPHEDFETNLTGAATVELISGFSYGGCEDPRVTKIGDRLYMTYVAFDGYSPQRIALTSIHIKDFLAQRFNWEKPVLITPPGVIDKSGCLLPEKINDKYVFFHRVFPNIQIDYVDSLNFDGKTNFLKGEFEIKIRPDKWDSRKIGAGAPPIRTKYGWLLIYYAVDDKDDGKYHIGAMLLDINKPQIVLHRTDSPIIMPETEYEMEGFKPGIVYPCGAVVINNTLMVYYGAADSYVCVATSNLDSFLDDLIKDKAPKLHSYSIKEVIYS